VRRFIAAFFLFRMGTLAALSVLRRRTANYRRSLPIFEGLTNLPEMFQKIGFPSEIIESGDKSPHAKNVRRTKWGRPTSDFRPRTKVVHQGTMDS
jgi:hypothetical protein